MRIIAREGHLGLEVAAVVGRIGVENDEGDTPLKNVVVHQL